MTGLVIIAPRDPRLAASFAERGLTAVQLDLEPDASVEEVAAHLVAAVDSLDRDRQRGLPIGLFAAGRHVPAALIAGAQRIDVVSAIVCVGGRPELAGPWLQVVRTPTLLIAGSRDTAVLRANRDAARAMVARHRVVAIPGATNVFEEPGALDEVAVTAGTWFVTHARAAIQARAMQRSLA